MGWQLRSAAVAIAVVMSVATAAAPAGADTTPAPTAPVAGASPTDDTTPSDTPAPSDGTAPADDGAGDGAGDEKPGRPDRQDRLRLPMHKGDTGDYVTELQERLAWLSYDIDRREVRHERFGATTKDAVRALQTKFFLDPSGRVNERTWSLAKSLSLPIGWVPKACRQGTAICVDKTQKLLRYLRDGKVVLALDARFGASGTPTREGVFHVFSKSRDHVSSLYNSWMPFAMFFSGGQAVHYSPFFARDGYYGASHGCIGVRDIEAAEWLFDRVAIGTPVVVYRS